MLTKITIGALLLAPLCAWGQQAAPGAGETAPAQSPSSTLPKSGPALVKVILGSYYHPDSLELMECDLSVDWNAFFRAQKITVPEARMQVLKDLKIHERAVRGRPAEIQFNWADGAPATKEQMESGFRQMVGGFYQIYWPLMAGPMLSPADKVEEIASLPDGSAKLTASSAATKIHLLVNPEGLPTHYDFDAGAMKGVGDISYVLSPNPVPGDMRRIGEMRMDEQVGESSFKLDFKLDYQDVNGFSIPQNLTIGVVGSYTFNLKFSGCKASAVVVSQ